jgi:hypothetical protein
VAFAVWPQAEVLLQELPRGGHVVDREVDVVELHRCIISSPGSLDSVLSIMSD